MKLSIYKGKLKSIKIKREMNGMSAILQLDKYRDKNFDPSIDSFSFIDMLFDKEKRQATYRHYDSIYVETDEEKSIFEEMSARRKRKK